MDAILIQYKNSNKSFESGKKMVEYISQHKQSQHLELVLDFGIHVSQKDPSVLNAKNINLVEEFFLAALDLK